MKRETILRAFITIAIISFSTFLAKSQTSPSDDIDELRIDQFDLTITGKAASPVNTILLGANQFLRKFGTPVKISREYAEEEEDTMTHYTYHGAEAWYMNDALQAMSITSSHYSFQLKDGRSIKVGDNVRAVINLFPKSWTNRQFNRQIFVSLRNKIGPVDMNFLFEYDVNTNLITGIHVQQ